MSQSKVDFKLPIVCADECRECEECGELVCPICDLHYVDCPHPGPHSEEGD